jgi:anti-sigma factor RsiW
VEQIHDYDDVCARYLLGELSEQEQTQLEEAYFADDALFERFRAVKDDLIDAYARGDLTGQKRERFEQHFPASGPRRERVEEARGFIRAVTAASTDTVAVDRTTPAQTPAATSWWQSVSKLFASRPLVWQGAPAVLLLVALAGSWMLVKHFQGQRAERERIQNEEAARRQQEVERGRAVVPPVNENRSELPGKSANSPPANSKPTPEPVLAPRPRIGNKQTAQPQPAQIASIVLLPFSSRDGNGSSPLMLRPDTREVVLHLAIKGDDYRRYDAVLRTLGGEQVLHRRGLGVRSSASGKSVTLTLDPAILQHQDYIVTLSGLTAGGKLEAVSDYYFRVERSVPQSTPTPNHQ